MKARIEATRAARRWLLNLQPATTEEGDYKEMGIYLAENIIDQSGTVNLQNFTPAFEISTLGELVEMSRDAMIELSRISYNKQIASINNLNLILPHLALSYARMDDLQSVAALLKLAAVYQVPTDKLEDAWNYVLLQQNSNGSFGLLAAEIMLLGQQNNIAPYLMMTTEVLQSIAAAEIPGCMHATFENETTSVI